MFPQKMAPPLQNLIEARQALLLTENSFEFILKQHQHTLLFFAGEPNRHPESADLAVILPELMKAFDHTFQIGVIAPEFEQTLQQKYTVTHKPTLVMLRDGAYLGAIAKLQDWAGYCAGLKALLEGEVKPVPGKTLPVMNG